MAIIKEYDEKKFTDLLKKYAFTYSDIYDKKYIIDLFGKMDNGVYSDSVEPSVASFYAEYDLSVKEKNRYKNFLEILKSLYSDLKNKNIVEVGGGPIPHLGREISQILVPDKTITVYDKKISLRNNEPYKNLIVKKEEFKENTDISKSDIVVGLAPCDATKVIIKSACENKKEFVVALCACELENKYYGILEWYLKDMQEFINKYSIPNGLGEAQMINYDISNPGFGLVLHNKKRR